MAREIELYWSNEQQCYTTNKKGNWSGSYVPLNDYAALANKVENLSNCTSIAREIYISNSAKIQEYAANFTKTPANKWTIEEVMYWTISWIGSGALFRDKQKEITTLVKELTAIKQEGKSTVKLSAHTEKLIAEQIKQQAFEEGKVKEYLKRAKESIKKDTAQTTTFTTATTTQATMANAANTLNLTWLNPLTFQDNGTNGD